MAKIKVGDIVRLKTSSPDMTVTDKLGASKVEVTWFIDGTNRYDQLVVHIDSLYIKDIVKE